MNEKLERLRAMASRIVGEKIYAMPRDEWESTMRSGGEPTKLDGPLSPFKRTPEKAKVVTYASSSPQRGPAGYHQVRLDPPDAPNIYNTDSYDEVLLPSLAEWSGIVASARLTDGEAESLLATHVFLVARRRRDHHSPVVPSDIATAKPKKH
jgi:hypothetical protein